MKFLEKILQDCISNGRRIDVKFKGEGYIEAIRINHIVNENDKRMIFGYTTISHTGGRITVNYYVFYLDDILYANYSGLEWVGVKPIDPFFVSINKEDI